MGLSDAEIQPWDSWIQATTPRRFIVVDQSWSIANKIAGHSWLSWQFTYQQWRHNWERWQFTYQHWRQSVSCFQHSRKSESLWVFSGVCKLDNRPFLKAFGQKCYRNTDKHTRDLSDGVCLSVGLLAYFRSTAALSQAHRRRRDTPSTVVPWISTQHSHECVSISTLDVEHKFVHDAGGACLHLSRFTCACLRTRRKQNCLPVYTRLFADILRDFIVKNNAALCTAKTRSIERFYRFRYKAWKWRMMRAQLLRKLTKPYWQVISEQHE